MKRKATRTPTTPESCAVTAASGDGVVVFKLEACAGCLHVERSQLRTGAGRVTQSMRFEDDLSFIRWCDADRLRFTYPLLYANLKRSGCALFPAAP